MQLRLRHLIIAISLPLFFVGAASSEPRGDSRGEFGKDRHRGPTGFIEQHADELGMNAESREAVEKIAAWAAASGVRVDAIRHSGKLRAEQTAKILAAALQPGGHPQVVPAQASTSWNASTSNERMTSTSLSMAASPMIPSCSSSR